jgi:hypothetical protein
MICFHVYRCVISIMNRLLLTQFKRKNALRRLFYPTARPTLSRLYKTVSNCFVDALWIGLRVMLLAVTANENFVSILITLSPSCLAIYTLFIRLRDNHLYSYSLSLRLISKIQGVSKLALQLWNLIQIYP